MKKIISILVILFCFTTSYAQEAKPTKQETMDWIGNTLLKYKNINSSGDQWGKFEYSNFAYSNGIISYTQKFTSRIDGGSLKELISINLNKALTLNYSFGEYILIGSNIIKIKEVDEPETYSNSFSICATCNSNHSVFIIVDENNILERLRNAINALLEFNKKEQPKEAY